MRKKTLPTMTLVAATAACITFAATSANAATIAIANSTFESPAVVGGLPAATSWTGVNTAEHSVYVRANNAGLGPRFGYAVGTGEQRLTGSTYQAETTYTFQGLAVDNDTAAPNGPNITFQLGYYNISNAFTSLATAVYDLDGINSWTLQDGVTFTTGLADAAIGRDIGVRILGAPGGVWFDNVTLDATAIPEPTAALLGGLGLLGLLRRRR